MPGRSRFASTRLLTALAMTALLLGGCSTWRMQGQAPATVVSNSKNPPHIRVTLHDETRFETYRAVIEGDSLVGFATDPTSSGSAWGIPGIPAQANRVAVALSDIRTIEVRGFDGAVRAGVVLLLAWTVALPSLIFSGDGE
jgi:hypothetical protein